MMRPSLTTTAPTSGFGCTRPQPRRASASARRMCSAGPASKSDADPKGEAAEERALLDHVGLARVGAAAQLPPGFGDEAEQQHGVRYIREQRGAICLEVTHKELASSVGRERRRIAHAG